MAAQLMRIRMRTGHSMNVSSMMDPHRMMHMGMMHRGEQLAPFERLDLGLVFDLPTFHPIAAAQPTIAIVDRHGPSRAKLEREPRSTAGFAERNRQDRQSRTFGCHSSAHGVRILSRRVKRA